MVVEDGCEWLPLIRVSREEAEALAGGRGGGRRDEVDLRGCPPEPEPDHERCPPADGGGEEFPS